MSPTAADALRGLSPAEPETFHGDSQASVSLPRQALSIEPTGSLQMAMKLAAAWLLFRAVVALKGKPGASIRIARAVVANAALLSLFAIIQGLTWNGCLYWVRPANDAAAWSVGGPFLSHSHLAAYLNMGLGLALGLTVQTRWRDIVRGDSAKIWLASAGALIAIGVIVSHSRSGFLGLIVASVVVAVMLGRKVIALSFVLAIALGVMAIYLVLIGNASPFGTRLATILDLGNEGYQTRLELWSAAIAAWWSRPLWGHGFGSFAVAINPWLMHAHRVFFSRAENECLDVLVEGGMFALALTLLFLAGVASHAGKVIRARGAGGKAGLVLGACFGLIAVGVQSVADFAPHVPADGALAIALCGLIVRAGRDTGLSKRSRDGSDDSRARVSSRSASIIATLGWLSPIALSVVLVIIGAGDAWVENRLDQAELPPPGVSQVTAGTLETTSWGLDEARLALEDVLHQRPNWAEGHLRLGLVQLALYRRLTQDWLENAGASSEEIGRLAEPISLLASIRAESTAAGASSRIASILDLEPVTQHLVPAARSFIEARRCSPFLALPHAELAALEYLFTRGDSSATYAARALGLAGNDVPVLDYLARIAAAGGERALAARCWRRCLEVDPARWESVADASAAVFSPDEILAEVAVDGSSAIQFADRLFRDDDTAERKILRRQYFQTGLERFARDRDPDSGERLFLEAHALANLEQPDRATKLMEAALTLEPGQSGWRAEYIEWLMKWGRIDEAHAQALSGKYFSPESPTIREALVRTAEALAQEDANP
jgi:O-antigen ligase/tetratricopeptide (TPR) repeat protein